MKPDTGDDDRWLAVNRGLAHVLELPAAEREPWLAELTRDSPEVAAEVRALLSSSERPDFAGFLAGSPGPWAGGAAEQDALVGRRVGAYVLESELGSGGMGSVWLAHRADGQYEGRAAIKFLHLAASGRAGRERFRREGQSLARFDHPNIARLLDAGVLNDAQPYLVLEYVEGEPIHEYCERLQLEVAARVRLFLAVIEAVAHAHSHLIVHRDIKPANILVTRDGTVKLLDFGIARLLDEEAGVSVTRVGGPLMTPEYAAPEQVTGGAVTTATDVYAAGLVLYLLLTGRHPTGAGSTSPADLVRTLVEVEPPHPSEVVSSPRLRRLLQGDLDTIIAKALKKDARERYPSAAALADDLRRHLANQPIAARADTLAYRTGKFVRRNRLAVALGGIAALAAIAGVVGTVVQARTVRAQRDFALQQASRAEAIAEFDGFLLSDAAPSGKPFTLNELLALAERIVARQRSTDANRVELLVSIGGKYSTQDDAASARRVLEQAYVLSRQLTEQTTRAKAACAYAGSLARDGELAQAETLFQQGIREVPDVPQFALDRVFCLRWGSEVARQRGDSDEAVVRAVTAQDVLQRSALKSDFTELHTAMEMAEAYRTAGRQREAAAAFEQAAALVSSLGRDETSTAIVLLNNWALALDQLGKPLEAEKVFRRVIDISRTGAGEGAVSPMILNNYAKTLRNLARLDEAADYAERAYAKAKEVDHTLVINQSLLERARIYRERREHERAAAMLAEVEPRLREVLPAGHYAFASVISERSLLEGEARDTFRALRLADEAVAMVEAEVGSGGQGSDFLPTLLLRRSTLRLDAGDPAGAATDALRALRSLEQAAEPGAPSSGVGRALLAHARVLHQQGKVAEARARLDAALWHLDAALGADHPDTQAVRHLLAADG